MYFVVRTQVVRRLIIEPMCSDLSLIEIRERQKDMDFVNLKVSVDDWHR
jgi:hypothetical protein